MIWYMYSQCYKTNSMNTKLHFAKTNASCIRFSSSLLTTSSTKMKLKVENTKTTKCKKIYEIDMEDS